MSNPNIKDHGFKKGKSGNPAGRPRKYISELREQGYTRSQVNDAIQVLMSMDEKELATVLENDKATMLEKTVAKAMIKSLRNGSLYSIETLLNRVYGQPKETIEQVSAVKINVSFNDNPTTGS